MAKFDKEYKKLLLEILENGKLQDDPNRKGTKRLNLTSYTLKQKVEDGFPALTLRKVSTKLAWAELSFFLSGSTDIRDLWKKEVNFWDKDTANFHGISEKDFKFLKNLWKQGINIEGVWHEMGKIYPYQYRSFAGEFDQIKWLIQELNQNPLSSSMVVSAWNPDDAHLMCLKPCHYGFQIIGRELEEEEAVNYKLNKAKTIEDIVNIVENTKSYGFEIHWNQRSTDVFLGTVVNIQFYWLLGMVLEELTGHKFLGVQADLKNVHLYDNSIEPARQLLTADSNLTPPRVKIVGEIDYNDLKNEQLVVRNYKHNGELRVQMKSYNK